MVDILILIPVIYLLYAVSMVRRRIGNMEREISLLMQRIEFIRREVEKVVPRRPAPGGKHLNTPAPKPQVAPPPIGGLFEDDISGREVPGSADESEIPTDGASMPEEDWDAKSLRGIPIPTPPPPPYRQEQETWRDEDVQTSETSSEGEDEPRGRHAGAFFYPSESGQSVFDRIRERLTGASRLGTGRWGGVVDLTVPRKLKVTGLVVAFAFVVFLTWANASGNMSDEERINAGVVLGAIMLVTGMKMSGDGRRPLAIGLSGAGLMILCLCGYAMRMMMRETLDMLCVWILPVLTTAAAVILVLRTGSLLIAMVGFAGAYFVPVSYAEVRLNLTLLCGSIVLLALGVLCVRRSQEKMRYAGYSIIGLLYTAAVYSAMGEMSAVSRMAAMAVFAAFYVAVSFAPDWRITPIATEDEELAMKNGNRREISRQSDDVVE